MENRFDKLFSLITEDYHKIDASIYDELDDAEKNVLSIFDNMESHIFDKKYELALMRVAKYAIDHDLYFKSTSGNMMDPYVFLDSVLFFGDDSVDFLRDSYRKEGKELSLDDAKKRYVEILYSSMFNKDGSPASVPESLTGKREEEDHTEE